LSPPCPLPPPRPSTSPGSPCAPLILTFRSPSFCPPPQCPPPSFAFLPSLHSGSSPVCGSPWPSFLFFGLYFFPACLVCVSRSLYLTACIESIVSLFHFFGRTSVSPRRFAFIVNPLKYAISLYNKRGFRPRAPQALSLSFLDLSDILNDSSRLFLSLDPPEPRIRPDFSSTTFGFSLFPSSFFSFHHVEKVSWPFSEFLISCLAERPPSCS